MDIERVELPRVVFAASVWSLQEPRIRLAISLQVLLHSRCSPCSSCPGDQLVVTLARLASTPARSASQLRSGELGTLSESVGDCVGLVNGQTPCRKVGDHVIVEHQGMLLRPQTTTRPARGGPATTMGALRSRRFGVRDQRTPRSRAGRRRRTIDTPGPSPVLKEKLHKTECRLGA